MFATKDAAASALQQTHVLEVSESDSSHARVQQRQTQGTDSQRNAEGSDLSTSSSSTSRHSLATSTSDPLHRDTSQCVRRAPVSPRRSTTSSQLEQVCTLRCPQKHCKHSLAHANNGQRNTITKSSNRNRPKQGSPMRLAAAVLGEVSAEHLTRRKGL